MSAAQTWEIVAECSDIARFRAVADKCSTDASLTREVLEETIFPTDKISQRKSPERMACADDLRRTWRRFSVLFRETL